LSGAHGAPPASFWVAGVAIVVLIVGAAIALGPLGEPAPPRQGSVLKALERRSDPLSSPEDNS
jgi:hypothetical protein